MNCIKCVEPAEYIFNGNSLCKVHFQDSQLNDFDSQVKYEELIKIYKGNIGSLHKYMKMIALSKGVTELSFRYKVALLDKLIYLCKVTNCNMITLDSALHNAISRKIVNVNYITPLLKIKMSKKNPEMQSIADRMKASM